MPWSSGAATNGHFLRFPAHFMIAFATTNPLMSTCFGQSASDGSRRNYVHCEPMQLIYDLAKLKPLYELWTESSSLSRSDHKSVADSSKLILLYNFIGDAFVFPNQSCQEAVPAVTPQGSVSARKIKPYLRCSDRRLTGRALRVTMVFLHRGTLHQDAWTNG